MGIYTRKILQLKNFGRNSTVNVLQFGLLMFLSMLYVNETEISNETIVRNLKLTSVE